MPVRKEPRFTCFRIKCRSRFQETPQLLSVLLKSNCPATPIGRTSQRRYAWGRNPLANLQVTGNKDLPFATQRSDDWKMEQVPLVSLAFHTVPNEPVPNLLCNSKCPIMGFSSSR